MAAEGAAWRLGDAAAYERATALADRLLAELARSFRANPSGDKQLREEAAELRLTATTVDGLDRVGIDQVTEEWAARLKSLRGEQ